jgi:NADPH-dependent 2,4-dienoyl-CoA reductase/sulfur reductase-like enzyme
VINNLVIVGASLAGLRAAQAARKAGFTGALTLVGGEARLPYDRPPLSKAYLDESLDAPVEPFFLTEQTLRSELEADLRLGEWAVGLNTATRRVWLDSAEGADELSFDALIIATGASPRVVAGGTELSGVLSLRTLDDARALRAALEAKPRAVVIGAGFIGSEIASALRRRGLPVTVLEAAQVPLVRSVGEQVGRECARLHQVNGTDLRCGVTVSGLVGDEQGRVCAVSLEDGSSVPAELVVCATGVAPNTAWLRGSGLPLHHGDGGVICNESLGVGLPGIYAAGDVAHVPHPLNDGALLRMEHWTNASEQGAQAARNALNPDRAEPMSSVPYFWSDWYGSRIQFVGVPHADEVRVISEERGEDRFLALYRRGERLTGCMAVNRAGQVMKFQRLIAKARPWEDALRLAGVG